MKKVDQEEVIENAKRGAIGGSVSGSILGFTNKVAKPGGLAGKELRNAVLKIRGKNALVGVARGAIAAGSAMSIGTMYANRRAVSEVEDAGYRPHLVIS